MNRILLKDGANTRSGVVWHTQGSGKTLTMIMLTKMILRESMQPNSMIKQPRFVMVTDRINLDKQIRDNFIHTQMSPHRAKTGKGLIELLKEESNTVITALVNKFEAAVKQFSTEELRYIEEVLKEAHDSASMRAVSDDDSIRAYTGSRRTAVITFDNRTITGIGCM